MYYKTIIQESQVQSILINKVYKFNIYFNRKRQALIAKNIGCSRFVYNL
ncbi:helix-turn-helix domain-containing protein [Bacillus thuringiensis]|nr:helix-turn-helix domain-containing protein [Bacillus thuringiensis]